MIANTVIGKFTINGRDYELFRVGLDPKHWSWNVLGVRPLYTPAEQSMPDRHRPHLPYAYASPVAASRGWFGHPDAPISEGWRVIDGMDRVVFGYATIFADVVQIAADGLKLP